MNAVFYHEAVRSPRVGMDSMQVMIRNMTQLVRIAGDVNCNDLVVLDLHLWAASQSQRSDFLQIAARAASSE
jgi:hypothetical protein